MQQTNNALTIHYLPVSEGFKLENLAALAEGVKGKGSCRISTDYELIYLKTEELSFIDRIINFIRSFFSNQKVDDIFETIRKDVRATLTNHIITHLVENQKKAKIPKERIEKVLHETQTALERLENSPNPNVDLEHGIVHTDLLDLEPKISVRKAVETSSGISTFNSIEEMIEELKYRKALCEELLSQQIDGLEDLQHDILAGITELMQNIIDRKPYRSRGELVLEKNFIEDTCLPQFHQIYFERALSKNPLLKESLSNIAVYDEDLPHFVE